MHQIGVGVLGPVYRTYQPSEDRLVAVKAFHLDITPEQAQAFIEVLERLVEMEIGHPGLVAPLGVGIEEDVPYMAQEYVAAESLDVAMRHYSPAAVETAMPFIAQMGAAIDAAHERGVVHGALHLRDVFVTPDEARVTGFGVVKALEEVGLAGPIRRPYSAPEVIAGRAWGGAADRFALAAIAYELLTGRRAAGTGEQVTERLRTVEGVADPEALQEAFATALAEDPEGRFSTAGRFVSALDRAVGEPAGGTEQPEPEISAGRNAAVDLLAGLEMDRGERGIEDNRRQLDPLEQLEALEEGDATVEPFGDPRDDPEQDRQAVQEDIDDQEGDEDDEDEAADLEADVMRVASSAHWQAEHEEAESPDARDDDRAAYTHEPIEPAAESDDAPAADLRISESGAGRGEGGEEAFVPDVTVGSGIGLNEDSRDELGDAWAPTEEGRDREQEGREADGAGDPSEGVGLEDVLAVTEADEPSYQAVDVEPERETLERESDAGDYSAEYTVDAELGGVEAEADGVESDRPFVGVTDDLYEDGLADLPPPDSSGSDGTWQRRAFPLAALAVIVAGLAYVIGVGLVSTDEPTDQLLESQSASAASSTPEAAGQEFSEELVSTSPEPARAAGVAPSLRPVSPSPAGPADASSQVAGGGNVDAAGARPDGTPRMVPVESAAGAPETANAGADTTRAVRLPPPVTPETEPPSVARAAPSDVPEPEAGSGWILVRTDPPGATVTIDGLRQGETPLSVRDVPFGRHRLEVSHPGFRTSEREVTLSADNNVVPVGLDLSPAAEDAAARAASTGSLAVQSRPPGARVMVDGAVVGATPVVIPVAVGRRQVRIEGEGYLAWVTTVLVSETEETRVNASLERLEAAEQRAR